MITVTEVDGERSCKVPKKAPITSSASESEMHHLLVALNCFDSTNTTDSVHAQYCISSKTLAKEYYTIGAMLNTCDWECRVFIEEIRHHNIIHLFHTHLEQQH